MRHSVLTISLALLALWPLASACSRQESQQVPLPVLSNDPYLGTWKSVGPAKQELTIQPEGDAYVISFGDGKKFAGTKTNGVLRMSATSGMVDILYVQSSDHLVAGGDEYKRFDPTPRRAMFDIRTIAMAVEANAIDNRSASCAGYPSGNLADVEKAVVPLNIKVFPANDPWGHAFYYRSDGCSGYVIVSAGFDGKFPPDLETPEIFGKGSVPSDDIVFANGEFVRSPAGWDN